jgi:hypothetical protein
VAGDHVRLMVLPTPWHRTPYLPVGTGVLVKDGSETVLNMTFRPQLMELTFLVAWSAFVLGSGGPMWFGLGIPFAYHVFGCLNGFIPEVTRVADLLESTLKRPGHLS